jgi:hypothetical protein
MKRLEGRNIGLDGVVAQQDNYQRSGFKLAWRNIRYQGNGGLGKLALPETDTCLVPLATVPFETLTNYDRSFFPVDRSAFLKSWISQPNTLALGFIQAGNLIGYGVLRPCRNGSKIGPLFADSAEVAETLFTAFRARVSPDQSIFLDVPECHGAALSLAERHGLHPMFETARMYTREIPEIAIERTYGITSYELG